ncbi:MAG TPA: RpiB/LacA/LacB family sugar-phosphate isomerase [Planctomycetota bacterium]|nr:RpiB/LacA/LacB family sugar-phosphate isomerase [Planctomycetota bacterium]
MEPELESVVRRVVASLATERQRPSAPRPAPAAAAPAAPRVGPRRLIDAAAIGDVPRGGTLEVPADAIVTPFAADLARERGIRLIPTGSAGAPAIAVGADHAGFALKEALRARLVERGLSVKDLGTYGESPCDYPDFAVAVARAVATGAARFGIVVDGAGIGSAMAANRVPGVLAAFCPDVAAARNAREHNCASVLTLGARRVDEASALAIVDAFLSTPEGEARHRRRVDKILALDRHVGRSLP